MTGPIEGNSSDPKIAGVTGRNNPGPGVVGASGTGNGVEGGTLGTNKSGVLGTNLGTGPGVSGQGSPGVRGEGTSGAGVEGHVAGSSPFPGVSGTSLNGDGVYGTTSGGNGSAVRGEHTGGGNGVYGSSVNGNAIVGQSEKGNAGFFVGSFSLNGKMVHSGDYSLNGNMVHSGDYSTTGTVTVAKDIVLSGADCAEEFDVGIATEIDPGTVMIIDGYGVLQPCYKAYDKTVAGVISGAGDYRPGMILDRTESSKNRMPVALVGKVYCKVDAKYAAIEVGDLLTTSPTLGHAMKADDPSKTSGAVIGKALRPLRSGIGLIPILIALQ